MPLNTLSAVQLTHFTEMDEPAEAAKFKIPTGKKVKQQLDKWWAELEPNCYYFEEDNDVCECPIAGSPEYWPEESEQAEVSPWRAVYGGSL